MGQKVPFWQFLKILKNCQNGTFLPMHENHKIFGSNVRFFVTFSEYLNIIKTMNINLTNFESRSFASPPGSRELKNQKLDWSNSLPSLAWVPETKKGSRPTKIRPNIWVFMFTWRPAQDWDRKSKVSWPFISLAALYTMAIRVVEFSNSGYKIRQIFA